MNLTPESSDGASSTDKLTPADNSETSIRISFADIKVPKSPDERLPARTLGLVKRHSRTIGVAAALSVAFAGAVSRFDDVFGGDDKPAGAVDPVSDDTTLDSQALPTPDVVEPFADVGTKVVSAIYKLAADGAQLRRLVDDAQASGQDPRTALADELWKSVGGDTRGDALAASEISDLLYQISSAQSAPFFAPEQGDEFQVMSTFEYVTRLPAEDGQNPSDVFEFTACLNLERKLTNRETGRTPSSDGLSVPVALRVTFVMQGDQKRIDGIQPLDAQQLLERGLVCAESGGWQALAPVQSSGQASTDQFVG